MYIYVEVGVRKEKRESFWHHTYTLQVRVCPHSWMAATFISGQGRIGGSAPKLLPLNYCIPLGPPGRCARGRGCRSSPTFAT